MPSPHTHTHKPPHRSQWTLRCWAYQLQGGEVALPPEKFLHVGPKPCQAVVKVHDHVDEAVEQANEERCKKREKGWLDEWMEIYFIVVGVYSVVTCTNTHYEYECWTV